MAFTGELLAEFKHSNIVEAKKVMTYESFVNCLKDFKVAHALYLDMGSGWNYAWYRDKDGSVKEIFPESKTSPCYKYRTNWITFYKKTSESHSL